jgi:hypothetical protein
MAKTITIILFMISVSNCAFSQDDFVMWYKLSPEIRLNIEDTPLEFRWRPVDYLITPDVQYGRTDVMVGVNLWKFKVFSYSKFDELERMWTGARLDFNLSLFNKKLLVNIQERYFWGLNEQSLDQFYLVDFIMYKITKNIHFGVLSYGQWYVEQDIEDGLLSVGPVVNIVLPANFNILITSGKEIFHQERYITIFRLGYKIFWKNQNKPIDFGI